MTTIWVYRFMHPAPLRDVGPESLVITRGSKTKHSTFGETAPSVQSINMKQHQRGTSGFSVQKEGYRVIFGSSVTSKSSISPFFPVILHCVVAAMIRLLALTSLACLPLLVTPQQIGRTPEIHPRLTTQTCTKRGGCVTHETSVVLDALTHSIDDIHTGQSCETSSGGLNTTICPTAETCAKNCALEGINNYAEHGVYTDGDSITLRQYLGSGSNITTVSPRLYLLDESGKDYDLVKLLNQEISFTVNVSNLPCGMNGALYMASMDATGGRSKLNPAGATYGTGYCDAQCGVDTFINGVANVNSLGSCCTEMDLWEANAEATQLTPHPCNVTGLYECSGGLCGSDGVCDKDGCGFNPYGEGAHSFYGPSSKDTVDTTKIFTVVTQFLTDDNTSHGTLNQIRRLYVQDGKVIQNAAVQFDNQTIDSLTPSYCAADDAEYDKLGGMAQMGKALEEGMTLIFSIWNTASGFMSWLDSGNAGPCNSTQGNPILIEEQDPGTSVTFSNIKWGEIGSTYQCEE